MRIAVKVKPGSKAPGITAQEGSLILRVRERAVEGAANDACIRMLADALEIPPSRVRLLRGARSREKLFDVDGVAESEARSRLRL